MSGVENVGFRRIRRSCSKSFPPDTPTNGLLFRDRYHQNADLVNSGVCHQRYTPKMIYLPIVARDYSTANVTLAVRFCQDLGALTLASGFLRPELLFIVHEVRATKPQWHQRQ